MNALLEAMRELEVALIPHGLHVVGRAPSREARIDLLAAMHESLAGVPAAPDDLARLVDRGAPPAATAAAETWAVLAKAAGHLAHDTEIAGLLRALEGRYVRPVAGADVLRTPSVLPTGRNLHGFDPFRIPSAHALRAGAAQAQRLLDRHRDEGGGLPESIAVVLWGTDNLKSEGAPIAQVLWLIGALPRYDGYGRLAGATLIPLETLGRPRIDVVVTLSGIFRDLLPLQTRLLAEAFHLAAAADEDPAYNCIRRHALDYMARTGCDLETAALRVFGNADGAYGANVNHLIDNGRWQDEDELAELFTRRKSFAYGRSGRPQAQAELLGDVLSRVEVAYQNLESVEVGVTTLDQYFDTLGGISRAVARAKGDGPAVYVGDHTYGEGAVRTLAEQVAFETRTRVLNPKWHEGMLQHGYEGVRQIEAAVTNTMGWSATTGQVAPWIYQQIAQTFLSDPAMYERLAALNLGATAKVAHRLLEACERKYWEPDGSTLELLQRANDDLEDRLEGICQEVAA
jgi:magnesium chelatase subunit H